MTRLASSARDFAIACLARGDDGAAGDALLTIGDYAADAALRDHFPWRSAETGPDGKLVLVWRGDRRVRARVALYLRLLRRAEAEERDPCGWAGWPESVMVRDFGDWYDSEWYFATPWRPLWLDAPPHSAEVTPAQRRNAIAAGPTPGARSISEP